jgi:hypothetical protein
MIFYSFFACSDHEKHFVSGNFPTNSPIADDYSEKEKNRHFGSYIVEPVHVSMSIMYLGL